VENPVRLPPRAPRGIPAPQSKGTRAGATDQRPSPPTERAVAMAPEVWGYFGRRQPSAYSGGRAPPLPSPYHWLTGGGATQWPWGPVIGVHGADGGAKLPSHEAAALPHLRARLLVKAPGGGSRLKKKPVPRCVVAPRGGRPLTAPCAAPSGPGRAGGGVLGIRKTG